MLFEQLSFQNSPLWFLQEEKSGINHTEHLSQVSNGSQTPFQTHAISAVVRWSANAPVPRDGKMGSCGRGNHVEVIGGGVWL